MRKAFYILIILLILSCNDKTTEYRYYPNDLGYSNKSNDIIGLDTTKLNFLEITKKAKTYRNKSKKMMVEFDDKKIKKRIIPYFYDGGLIKSKNVLVIKSDSILIDEGYPLSDLQWILRRHYQNKGKILHYSDSPRKALVEISLDTNSNGQELKTVLTKLTRSFDNIQNETNDTIELRVFFDPYLRIPPPPPPSGREN